MGAKASGGGTRSGLQPKCQLPDSALAKVGEAERHMVKVSPNTNPWEARFGFCGELI